MGSSEFEPKGIIERIPVNGNGRLKHISEVMPAVLANIEASVREAKREEKRPKEKVVTRTSVNGSNGLSNHDRAMFYHAAYRGEIPDKDTLQKEVFEPTVVRVVIPAVRAYESTLRNIGKFPPIEAKRVAKKMRQHYEGEVLGVASVPSKERPTILEEVGKFVNMFLPRDAVLNALRILKTDLQRNGVPTTVRHEIFPSITRTSK